ncbi:LacI family DNA-binding transcriptional regulator [Paenibacillus sp. GXUN7292]|uniref:LacI family DNA-binding transcriptional regulator n=1 Tax=Paenibacillus sp. GXUN7292 TaxID=3422499 RepID=UPI003D7D9E79
MITIKDIAEQAGVSFSTVSKALRNSPLVKEHTKQHILSIAKEMGYQPNLAARSLVSKKSGAIGVVWPSVERAALSSLLTALNDALEEEGYTVLLSISRLEAALDTFRRYQVDAIIVFGDQDSKLISESTLPPNTPIITYGAAGFHPWSTVDVKRGQSIRLALRHLASLGHHHIAYIGDPQTNDPLQTVKIEAFEDESGKLGLASGKQIIVPISGLDVHDGYMAMKQLIEQGNVATAIISGGIDLTRGILRAAAEARLLVPQDISIVSYDNLPQLQSFEVPMTAVGVAITTISEAIAQVIIQLIGNQQRIQTVHLEPELIVRSSTAPPASS